MRIDAYMQVNQLYQSTKAKRDNGTEKTQRGTDTFEISNLGKELAIAKNAVNEASSIREDKVEELKSAIDSGSYDLSMDRLVEKLTNKYFS